MTTEIIEGTARDVTPPPQPAALTLFNTDDPGAVVDRATAVSAALMKVVRSQNLAVTIWQGGKPSEYLKVEAWTLLGSMVGVFPVTVWTKPIVEGNRTVGWEARVEARTRDGGIVGAAEAMCMRDEKTTKRDGTVTQRWLNADEHALRSMAQTRGVSKALAAPLRFIAVIGGFAGTPAEEMPHGETQTAADPTPAGPLKAGDACPTCLQNGVKWAKLRDYKGMLQCNGKLPSGAYANHPAPLTPQETVVDDTQIPLRMIETHSLPESRPPEQIAEADGSSLPVVLSPEDVHMMVRQIRDAKSRIAEEIATCEADRNKLRRELNMVDEHQERVTKDDRARIAFLEGQLTAHLLHLRANDDRVKSIKTPWGDVTSREQPPEFERDDDALLPWAKAVGYIRTPKPVEPEVDWVRVKKECHVAGDLFLTPNGFAVPGVTVKPKPLRVEVETTPVTSSPSALFRKQGRSPAGVGPTLNVRITPVLLDRLANYGNDNHLSFAETARVILEIGLDHAECKR